MLAAGPLLVASQTSDPFLVSMAVLSGYLPILLFGVLGGASRTGSTGAGWSSSVDLVPGGRPWSSSSPRSSAGRVSIAVVLITLFVLGTAETFADSASGTLLPDLVTREDLGLANSRMQGAFLLTNQLVGATHRRLPVRGGHGAPVRDERGLFRARRAAGLTGRLSARTERRERSSLRTEMAEGIRWLLAHPPMRTLALTIFTFNVTFGAAWSVLVLYANERLDIGPVGFGLLTTAVAVGGIVGIVSYGRLTRRFALGDIMRAGLIIETLTHLSLAITTSWVVALATLVVFGAHAFVWGTTSEVVRQRAVPDDVLGRVTGVYRVANIGGLVIGTVIGGLLASTFGITAPFWFGFIGSALLVAVLWRRFADIVDAGEGSGGGTNPEADRLIDVR